MNLPSRPAFSASVDRPGQCKRAIGFICLLLAFTVSCKAPWHTAVFTFQEVMIPMRDGVHLQTVILMPVNQQGPLPILFRRTPYGVPGQAPEQMPTTLKELGQDGYIFVIQNLRGRFKSEGVFNFLPRSI